MTTPGANNDEIASGSNLPLSYTATAVDFRFGSEGDIAAHPINVGFCPSKQTSRYAHTAFGGRNLTMATMVIRIKMANTTACVIAKGGSV